VSDAAARATEQLLVELAEMGVEPEEFIRRADLDDEAAAYLRAVARGWRQESRVKLATWDRFVIPVAHDARVDDVDVEELARDTWEGADEMVRASWRVGIEVQEIERTRT
jgi:hypothetical protein